MLRKVYGDAASKPRPDAEWEPWIDLDRIEGEVEALLEYDAAQAERWFLNRKLAMAGAAFNPEAWDAKCKPRQVPDGAQITIGVDGAKLRRRVGDRGVRDQDGVRVAAGHHRAARQLAGDRVRA
jgi:hypothetical protein